MLVLKSDQVKYCVLTRKVDGQDETFSGVLYQDKAFVKGKSFAKDRGQEAIKQARQLFLDQKAPGLLLVVEDATGFTLWHQDNRAKLADVLSTIDLKELVAAMRNVGGVQIKDRQYHLKTYARCFVGSEAVSWLSNYAKIPKSEAIRLGQRLMDEKWIHHVADEHSFKDEMLFYRFYWDE